MPASLTITAAKMEIGKGRPPAARRRPEAAELRAPRPDRDERPGGVDLQRRG